MNKTLWTTLFNGAELIGYTVGVWMLSKRDLCSFGRWEKALSRIFFFDNWVPKYLRTTQSQPIPACRQWGLLTLPAELPIMGYQSSVLLPSYLQPDPFSFWPLLTKSFLQSRSAWNITTEDTVESCSDFQTGLCVAIQIADDCFRWWF